VESVEPGRTPLQDDLDHLGSILGKAALVIVAAIVALYAGRGSPLLEMFTFGIALAVAPTCEHKRRSRCGRYLAQRDRDADASGETRTVTRSGQDGPRPPDADGVSAEAG
jgi:hypothetical protein